MAERVGRLSERRGDYVRLEHSAEDPPEVERLGTLHRMPFKKTDFKQLISCKARWSGHSGLLECHGVLLSVKWIARSRRRHHRHPSRCQNRHRQRGKRAKLGSLFEKGVAEHRRTRSGSGPFAASGLYSHGGQPG